MTNTHGILESAPDAPKAKQPDARQSVSEILTGIILSNSVQSNDELVARLTPDQQDKVFSALKTRFENPPSHYKRPEGVTHDNLVKALLNARPDILYGVAQMENFGGEPDVAFVIRDANGKPLQYIICDLSYESPEGFRNMTLGQAETQAKNSFIDPMPEEVYRILPGEFDKETWSLLFTPEKAKEEGFAVMGCWDNGKLTTFKSYPDANPHLGMRGIKEVPAI